MRKIPTIFLREEGTWRLLDERHPDCEWVFRGEGVATRKYDGTCVLIRRDGLATHVFQRREVKPNKPIPQGFVEEAFDEVTGKRQGWVPFEPQGTKHPLLEALRWVDGDPEHAEPPVWLPGTYELVGPKVNGNPEGFETHRLIKHSEAEQAGYIYSNEQARALVQSVARKGWEGVVWHHPDGRMAKLKARDFR